MQNEVGLHRFEICGHPKIDIGNWGLQIAGNQILIDLAF